jgi:hypothetical protein
MLEKVESFGPLDTGIRPCSTPARDALGGRSPSLPGNALALPVRRDPYAWLLAAVTVALGLVFVAVDLGYNQGRLIAPIDDAYIHLQYGREIGEGHFFQYDPGDRVSTGASSFLYALLLGAAYAIGFRGQSFLPFAVGVGVVSVAWTAAATYLMGRRLMGRKAGLWAGTLVALSGPLLWGATSGMEVGLVALLITGTLLCYLREAPGRRFGWTPVLGALLALARPEGMILAVLVCVGMNVTIIRGPWSRGMTTARGLLALVWSWLPLAASAGQLLYFQATTGTFAANGIQAKSYLNNHPLLYGLQFVDQTITNLRVFLGVFSGISTQGYTFPGALLFFVLGVAYLVLARPQWRTFGLMSGLGFLCVVAAVSTLDSAQQQNLRYIQPFLPMFILLAVIGVFGLASAIANNHARRALAHGTLAFALLMSAVAVPKWAVRLGQQAATIRDSQVSMASWIRDNLPPNAVVGVKDVGAVAYFGGHRVIDLIGLATDGLAAASDNGIGSLYEALAHLPASQRPSYLAVYDTPPGPPTAGLKTAGVIDKPLVTFTVQSADSDIGGQIVPFTRSEVYKANWEMVDSGARPETNPGGQIRDYINVGYLANERAHDYKPVMALVGVQPMSVLQRVVLPNGRSMVDSGRQILGGEMFTAHNLTPGEPVTLTARTQAVATAETMTSTGEATPATPPKPGAQPDPGRIKEVNVLVNGKFAGTLPLVHDPSGWHESRLVIPGDLVTGPSVTVQLTSVHPFLSPFPEYTSFGYWISQRATGSR